MSRELFLHQRLKSLVLSPRFVDLVLLAVLGVLGLYFISGIFRSGMMYQFDHSQHLVESFYDATVLIPKYHELIGWNPYYYLGYPQGQFNPPMGYAVYAALYYILSWMLSALDIYKIMIAIFYILPGFTLYISARIFGLSRLSGFFGGLIAMGTAGGFEQSGPIGMMQYGMYEFAGSIALIPLIFGVYHLAFHRKSWLLVLVCGILTAFVFLLHTLGGVFLLMVLSVYTLFFFGKQLIFHRKQKDMQLLRSVAKFVLIVVITLGLSSFWILPAFANQSYFTAQKSFVAELGNYGITYNDIVNGLVFGEKTIPFSPSLLPQSTPQVIVSLYNSNQQPSQYTAILFYQILMVLSAVGIAFCLMRRKSRFPALVALACLAIFFFISLGPTYYEWLWRSSIFHLVDIRPGRAVAPARIFLSLAAGAAIGEGLYFVFTGLTRKRSLAARSIRFGATIFVLLLSFAVIANSLSLMPQLNLGATTNDYSSATTLPQLFNWLNANVPNSSRIAFEEYPAPQQHLFAISPLFTEKQSVGSDYNFWWSSGASATQSAGTILSYVDFYSSSDISETLTGLNSAYVVAWKPDTKLSLQDYSSFVLVKQFGIFDVFQLKSYAPSFATLQNGTGNVTITSFQPESIVIHLTNVSSGSAVLVKVAYYTDWLARTSYGAKASIVPYNVTLPFASAVYMKVPVVRSGTYDITLSYSQRAIDIEGNAISGITLIFSSLGLALFLVQNRYDYNVSYYLSRSARRAIEIIKGATASRIGRDESE